MTAGRAVLSGSSRALRLDPSVLPICFAASDARADERTRIVELDRERVTVRRAVSGIRMRLSLKVSEFLGVAIRVIPPDASQNGAVVVMLEHRDQALSVPLLVATDGGDDVVAEWQRWGRVFGLPLLIPDGEGSYREPFARLGGVRVQAPVPRRRTRGMLLRRRPSILMRRKPGRPAAAPPVHRAEREIIARH
jgi:Family of unknown function (DUF6101)